MKTEHVQFHRPPPSGFTLVELIGVLAIIAIMTAAIAPNALRSIERAAVRAEVDSLHSLGDLAKIYLREKSVEPTVANWNSVAELAPYAWLSPQDMLYNRRQRMPNNPALPEATQPVRANQLGYITRVYVPDPTVANHRAMLISSMRFGVSLPAELLPLPTPAVSAFNFDVIWKTPDGTVPNLPGWGAWSNFADFLVIERINYMPVYKKDLQSLTLTLNNTDKASNNGFYNLILASGKPFFVTPQAVPPGAFPPQLPLTNCHPGDRLDLFKTDKTTLSYSYVVPSGSNGCSFEFDGTNWTPKP